MKKYVLLLVLLFAVVSCEEDIRFNNPSFQGMKDNVFWRAVESRATLSSDGSLLIEAYTANEVLSLKTTATTGQRYPLGTSSSKTAVYARTENGIEIIYRTGFGIGDGQIIITEYDQVNQTISGTFKFNALTADANASENLVVNFQQGIFYRVPLSTRVP